MNPRFLPRFEQWLKSEVDLHNMGQIGVAAAYSLLAGGKRFRPMLAMTVCETAGGDFEKIIPIAAGIEMIHTYSLIHDDLPAMDDDDLRRGRPSNHKMFGEAYAILAGDGLLTLAFEVMLTSFQSLTPKQVQQCLSIVAKAAGMNGMIRGQELDIAAENTIISQEQMEEIHHYKTGALIAACCETGAVVAGCSREQISLFSCFGYKLGLLFQISDDILDVTSTSEELGKPVGSDLESAKSTYVSLLGLVGAKEALSVVKKNCLETLQQLPYNTKNLAELIEFTAERKS